MVMVPIGDPSMLAVQQQRNHDPSRRPFQNKFMIAGNWQMCRSGYDLDLGAEHISGGDHTFATLFEANGDATTGRRNADA